MVSTATLDWWSPNPSSSLNLSLRLWLSLGNYLWCLEDPATQSLNAFPVTMPSQFWLPWTIGSICLSVCTFTQRMSFLFLQRLLSFTRCQKCKWRGAGAGREMWAKIGEPVQESSEATGGWSWGKRGNRVELKPSRSSALRVKVKTPFPQTWGASKTLGLEQKTLLALPLTSRRPWADHFLFSFFFSILEWLSPT